MKYLIVCITLLCSITFIQAQTYNTAVGIRIGSGIGLSVQQRVANKTTIEGLLHSKFKEEHLKLTVLAEQHMPILFKRFNIYYGGGVHKGFYTGNDADVKAQGNLLGVTLVGGAEITIGRFNISYDYKPAFNIKGGDKAFSSETGVSVRYVLWKRPGMIDKMKKKRKKKKKKKAKAKKKKKKNSDDDGFQLRDIFKKKES